MAWRMRAFLEEIVPRELVWAVTLAQPVVGQEARQGAMIGMAGLGPDDDGRCAELGYWLGRRYWGHGYATEAAAAVVRHALRTLGLPALTSAYFTDNPRSARVLGKLGFFETRRGERPCRAAGGPVAAVEMRLDAQSSEP